MCRISFLRCLLSVAAAFCEATFTIRAQSFEIFEPLGTSIVGASATHAEKVSPDGVAIIGHTSVAGVAGQVSFIWRADTGMMMVTNPLASSGSTLLPVDVANGGNRAVFTEYSWKVGERERGLFWTRTNGLQSLGQLSDIPKNNQGLDNSVLPAAISADGKVIVGKARTANTTVHIPRIGATYQMWEAFRWTAETGMVGLGDITGDPAMDLFDSQALGVSGDGRIVLGTVRYGGPEVLNPIGFYAAARWLDGGPPQMLPSPAQRRDTYVPMALSANGTYVVGSYEFGFELDGLTGKRADLFVRAFRWSEELGYTILQEGHWTEGQQGFTTFLPLAVSDDGKVVAGTLSPKPGSPGGAAIWTAERDLRLLSDVLGELGVVYGEISLLRITDISADGRVLVGNATDPDGGQRGFRAALWELPPRKIIVNSVADRPALSVANCCDTGEKLSNGDAECTLRAAIEAVNAGCGDRIEFAVPDVAIPKIYPQTPLPALDVPVDIDGTTQSGGKVEVTGTDSTGICLDLKGGRSKVRGLVINHFTGANGVGIRLFGGSKNSIVGNYLGTDVSGNARAFNVVNLVITNSSNNEIGTTKVGEGNIIGDLLWLSGEASSGNSIVANRIGVGADGTSEIGRNLGIVVDSGTGTRIGGGVGAGNVIAGISEFAVFVIGGRDTVIEGNFVGLDVPGVRALAGEVGIVVAGTADSSVANPAVRSNRVAGVRAGIVILGDKVTGATVTDNVVGPRFDGSGNLPEGADADYAKFGIRVDGSPNVQVLRNIVTGSDMNLLVAGKPQMSYIPCEDTDGDGLCNTASEIRLYSPEEPREDDDAYPDVGGVIVGANRLGLNEKLAVPPGAKQRFGVVVYRSAHDLQIRNNLVAGHSESDLWLRDGVRLQVMQNRIGSADGVPHNSQVGVLVDETRDVTIAPSGAFVGNTISFQKRAGVLVRSGATNLLIRENQIGTGPGGAVAWPNGSGITAAGVNITGLRIENNLINASVTNAVSLELSAKVVVQGNRIGVSSAGHAISNRVGVVVKNTPVDLRDNTIAHNGVGVFILGTQPALIQGGPLYQNGDGAPESAILYLDQSILRPVILVLPTPSAALPAGKVGFTFVGGAPSASSEDVEIEIYGNRAGERQGRTPLARRTVKPNQTFAILLEGDKGSALDTLPEFSATATQNGRTSMISLVKPVRVEVKPVVTATSPTDITLQWSASLPFTLERSHAANGPWIPVVTEPMIFDDTAIVTLPLDGDAQYFRLVLKE